jgi:hypothetical protein
MLLPGLQPGSLGFAKAQTLLVLVFLRKRAGDYLPELLRGTSGCRKRVCIDRSDTSRRAQGNIAQIASGR